MTAPTRACIPTRTEVQGGAGADWPAAARIDDVAVTVDVAPGAAHVFQSFAADLDQGQAALTRAGGFVREHLAAPEPDTSS